MPPPETPGNKLIYPHGASFAELLRWHLNYGTRPDGRPERPGKRWSNGEFSTACNVSERSVRNWRTGRRPINFNNIEHALFGNTNKVYADWRCDLRAAYDRDDTARSIQRVTRGFLDEEYPISEADELKNVIVVLDHAMRKTSVPAETSLPLFRDIQRKSWQEIPFEERPHPFPQKLKTHHSPFVIKPDGEVDYVAGWNLRLRVGVRYRLAFRFGKNDNLGRN